MTRRTATPDRARKAGQTPVILVLMVAGLLFLLMQCFDVFLAARAKQRIINAGDAAALAAASWQGKTLNLVGELNLVHLAAACDPALKPVEMTNAIDGANALAERIAFVGPLLGFHAANEAARRNFADNRADGSAPHDADMAALVDEEIRWANFNAEALATETWPNKSFDYANMLNAILAKGLCVGVDNARQLANDWTGNHLYFNRGFYNVVASGDSGDADWPWFCRYCGRHSDAVSMLGGFTKPSSLEGHGRATLDNPGFFGVGVAQRHLPPAAVSENALDAMQYASDVYADGAKVTPRALADGAFPWFYYAPGDVWHGWWKLNSAPGGEVPLLVGRTKPEYDVYGAAALCRVAQDVATASETSRTNSFPWRAAAKPFGALPDGRRVLDLFGAWDGGSYEGMPIVLPSFGFVRLFALSGVEPADHGHADLAWVRHLQHLRDNVRMRGCRFCDLLDKWESGMYRDGAQWLATHPHDEVCAPPGNGKSYEADEYNN